MWTCDVLLTLTMLHPCVGCTLRLLMVVVVLWWVDVALLAFWSTADLGVRHLDLLLHGHWCLRLQIFICGGNNTSNATSWPPTNVPRIRVQIRGEKCEHHTSVCLSRAWATPQVFWYLVLTLSSSIEWSNRGFLLLDVDTLVWNQSCSKCSTGLRVSRVCTPFRF